jgi:hypothetical protein
MRTRQQGATAAFDQANNAFLSIQVKDSSVLTEARGYLLSPEIPIAHRLFLYDSLKTYQLNPIDKNYWETCFEVDSAALLGSITRVRGDSVIQGFTCEKFEFAIDSTQFGPATGYMWVATELSQLSNLWNQIPNMGFFSQVQGFPIHIVVRETGSADQKFNLFTLKTVARDPLKAKDFKLPGDFTMQK